MQSNAALMVARTAYSSAQHDLDLVSQIHEGIPLHTYTWKPIAPSATAFDLQT